MIFSPTDLVGCHVDELPAREGPCWVGLDCGEATSGTAAAAVWPTTGRCEFWFSFGDVPSLAERGRVDGARYEEMARRGELTTYPGRVTPVAAFLEDLAVALVRRGRPELLAADGYKDAEVRDYLEKGRGALASVIPSCWCRSRRITRRQSTSTTRAKSEGVIGRKSGPGLGDIVVVNQARWQRQSSD